MLIADFAPTLPYLKACLYDFLEKGSRQVFFFFSLQLSHCDILLGLLLLLVLTEERFGYDRFTVKPSQAYPPRFY